MCLSVWFFKFSVQSKIVSFLCKFCCSHSGDDLPRISVSNEAWRQLPGETSKIISPNNIYQQNRIENQSSQPSLPSPKNKKTFRTMH